MLTSFMLGSWRGVDFRTVLQVDERHDDPGPGSVGTGIGEAGGELLDMAAQLGQRLIVSRSAPRCRPTSRRRPACLAW